MGETAAGANQKGFTLAGLPWRQIAVSIFATGASAAVGLLLGLALYQQVTGRAVPWQEQAAIVLYALLWFAPAYLVLLAAFDAISRIAARFKPAKAEPAEKILSRIANNDVACTLGALVFSVSPAASFLGHKPDSTLQAAMLLGALPGVAALIISSGVKWFLGRRYAWFYFTLK